MGSDAPLRSLTQRSVIPAPIDAVWDRVSRMEGVNDELMPYLKMMLPRRHRGKTLADIEVGTSVGKVRMLFGGLLPLDYDELTIVELTPGRGFREESSMASMRVWHHARTLTPLTAERTEVVDTVALRPRLLLRPAAPLLARFVEHLFRHRHRRLAAHFGG
ncbi:SRPBCC family protein [Gordonia sp. NPDC062954]|uniref:SRPBCC family protein n=1 Tax=Gordonia sp. NPDC062954 TaxID=3364003 RepID=UPI0037C69C66